MSGFTGGDQYGQQQQQGYYPQYNQSQNEGYSFDMSADFSADQTQQFQHYDPFGSGAQGAAPIQQPAAFMGRVLQPDPYATTATSSEFDDEPPLLEELGINIDHIIQKTLAVLNPMRRTEATILQDTDVAGPLVFCLALGCCLLLSGKLHFGYIYGIGVVGWLLIYSLLNLMSNSGVAAGVVATVLGYCLLPMVVLSALNIVFSLQGVPGIIVAVLAILWCSFSSSKLFVTALAMEHQQPLVAYPCALLYGVFALITIF